MRTVKSILLLLSAFSLWACSDYESTHSVAPIPIDRAISVYYSAREVRIKTQNTQSFPLIYEISNSLYCANPFYASEDFELCLQHKDTQNLGQNEEQTPQ